MADRGNDSIYLTEEDSGKISDWFNKKARSDIACAVCGEHRWFNHRTIVTPVIFNPVKNMHARDKLIPTAIVECKNCGNRLFFSTEKIGIDTESYREKRDSKE